MARLALIRLGLTPELDKLGWMEQFDNDSLVYVRKDRTHRHFLRLDAAIQLFAWSEILPRRMEDRGEVDAFHITDPTNMAGLSAILARLRTVHYGVREPAGVALSA
jgi:hypothetical protein